MAEKKPDIQELARQGKFIIAEKNYGSSTQFIPLYIIIIIELVNQLIS